MNRTIEDIQKDIELLGIKGGYDIEQLLTPQDCRRLSYEIERLNNIINELEKWVIDKKYEEGTYCIDCNQVLNRLQELKEGEKSEKN